MMLNYLALDMRVTTSEWIGEIKMKDSPKSECSPEVGETMDQGQYVMKYDIISRTFQVSE